MAKKDTQIAELPFNAEAEKAVIGGALISADAVLTVLGNLIADDFYIEKNRIVYNVIESLHKKKSNIDTLTVMEELVNLKLAETVSSDYLRECSDSLVALSSLNFYINIVKDQSVLRNMLLAIRDIDNKYKDNKIDDINSFITNSMDQFKTSVDRRTVAHMVKTSEMAPEIIKQIDEIKELNEGEVNGVTSGYRKIDFYTQGFQKGEITIVAARPNLGKTALALNFAFNAACADPNCAVAIFSLEMNRGLLFRRLLAADSGVNMSDIATGKLDGAKRAMLKASAEHLGNINIYIDDTPGVKLGDIITKSQQLEKDLKNQGKHLGLIIVDYIGLITTTNANVKNNDSRQEEVRKISLELKQLARELNVPLIAVSQLSRSVENRDSKRPMMSDLRDSGSLEQDADVIMLLYREDYYPNDKKGTKKPSLTNKSEQFEVLKEKGFITEGQGSATSLVEVNVAKNRNGNTGKAYLLFNRSQGKFSSLSEDTERKMRELEEQDFSAAS